MPIPSTSPASGSLVPVRPETRITNTTRYGKVLHVARGWDGPPSWTVQAYGVYQTMTWVAPGGAKSGQIPVRFATVGVSCWYADT